MLSDLAICMGGLAILFLGLALGCLFAEFIIYLTTK